MAQDTSRTRGARPNSLSLPRLFADGMVVQRDRPVAVWGWAAPGADGHGCLSRPIDSADRRRKPGAWRVSVPSGKAGGPFDLTVASGAQRTVFRDVLVGDVWVASGQSNMEFKLAQAANGAETIAAANDLLLRQFKVPTSWSNTPEDDRRWWRLDRSRHAARRAISRAVAILLRARAPKDCRRSDRHHQHHVGRKQHRDVDEPTSTRLSPTADGRPIRSRRGRVQSCTFAIHSARDSARCPTRTPVW